MSVNLSPLAGAGAQFFTDSGTPLTGGLLYTYSAGTTTPRTTYTDNIGATANSNPIVLDAAGRVPYEIWLLFGLNYKFVLKTSVGVTIGTWDNISGVNGSPTATSFYADAFTATAGQVLFTLSANPGSINNLDVSLDGSTLVAGDDFSWSGISITLNTPAFVNQRLRVAYSTVDGVQAISPGSVIDNSVAVGTDLYNRIHDTVSVKDYGAVGDGVTDDTAAIQAAFAYAYSISIGTITNPYANMNAGKVTVYFPAGKYIVSGKISTYDGIAIVGAGRISTVIQSSYNGNVIELQPATSYNAYGIEFSDFQVVGDRTKTSQIGIALMRPYSMYMSNVGVTACGSDGILARQALICEWHNIESFKNVGAGIRFTDGTTSWADTTPTNYPSNANRIVNAHCVFNDGPGIVHSSLGTGGVNGNVYDGGACEYNYYSSAAGTGYNIEILDRPYTPSEFVDMWCEGPVKAHVHVNMAATGAYVRFTRFKHFAGGAASYPERAIINDVGTVVLDAPYGTATQYRNVTGSGGTSKAPFRVNKAGGSALYLINDAAGSTVTGNLFVEDENQYTTGLQNEVPYMNNYGNFYTGNGPTFSVGFGYGYPAIKQEGQVYPQVNFRSWDMTNGTASGWSFGSGSVAVDTHLIRKGAGILGMGDGNSFQLSGASGATLKYTTGTANASVATTLGSVGPTGSTAGNPQGWLRITVAGTDRYIPYW